MKVLCFVVLVFGVVCCAAAPGSGEDNGKMEILSGVTIEKDKTGEEKINVKFEPGELKEAARTFEEARGKVKKYAPFFAGMGVKVIAVLALIFGGLTLLVTKALVVAKLAFFAASALGVQKLISGGGLNGLNSFSKITGFQSSPQQWSAPTAPASSYPYAARSTNIVQDPNDLAYRAQAPL